jgi:thiol:disulfide interchange protein DsbC
VQSVRKTAYGALYEVVVNGDVIYTDEKAEYLFIGKVVNADTKADQTALRIGEVNKIDFADLPLDAAVKTVKGNGKRVIAVFEDPNCGYCKKLRQSFKEMDNITVYTFLYNILSPDSAAKSANIWCAPDRAKAWDDWMTNGTAPPAASDKCATPNDQVMALGKKLMVNGTPAIFFADGRRVPGFMDAKHLEEKLAALK